VHEYPFFDVAFIDGSHTYEGCLIDFNNLKGHATYILIHDSAQNGGVRGAIETIESLGTHQVFNMDKGEKGIQWSLGEMVYHSYPGIAIVKVVK